MAYTEFEFCENYVLTFLSLINTKKEDLELIEETRNEVLSEASNFSNNSAPHIISDQERNRINQSFDRLIVDLLLQIKGEYPEVYQVAISRLDDILKRYKVYALRIGMKVPEGLVLQLQDYYMNYLRALNNMRKLNAMQKK